MESFVTCGRYKPDNFIILQNVSIILESFVTCGRYKQMTCISYDDFSNKAIGIINFEKHFLNFTVDTMN